MKNEPRECRCTKQEFIELGDQAWWMHRKCMKDDDYREYFGEDPPPETEKKSKPNFQGFAWE